MVQFGDGSGGGGGEFLGRELVSGLAEFTGDDDFLFVVAQGAQLVGTEGPQQAQQLSPAAIAAEDQRRRDLRLVGNPLKNFRQNLCWGEPLAQQGGGGGEHGQPFFQPGDRLFRSAGHGLHHEAAGRRHPTIFLDKDAEGDAGGGLFRSDQVMGQILGDLTAGQHDHAAVRLLQAKILGDVQKAGPAYRLRHRKALRPGEQTALRIFDIAAQVPGGVRLRMELLQRSIPFHGQDQSLRSLEQTAQQRGAAQQSSQGDGGSRIGLLQSPDLLDQVGGDGGGGPQAAVAGQNA
jgi:hypothetical protein